MLFNKLNQRISILFILLYSPLILAHPHESFAHEMLHHVHDLASKENILIIICSLIGIFMLFNSRVD